MGCDSPSALMTPSSNPYKDMTSPALLHNNPFLPGAPPAMNPMALPSLDPFFMQRLHSMVNLNMLLASQQQSPTSPGSSPTYGSPAAGIPPTAASPPLKLPFGGLSHAFFGGGASQHINQAALLQQQNSRLLMTALGEKKHSADSLRFKAARQQADNPSSIVTSAV